MKRIFTLTAFLIILFDFPSKSQNPILDKLFFSSYKVFEYLRYPSGVYRAKLPLSGTANTFAAISVTGMGLVSLCIADSMKWSGTAKKQALQTMKSLLGMNGSFKPKRNTAGFFYQYLDEVTGENAGVSPFSTIDNAVLVSGALFCKKYFKDDSITYYVNQLWNSYNWPSVIADPAVGKLYLALDSTGNGVGTPTRLYNEYIQVAWLAQGQECLNNKTGPATSLWNRFCVNPDNFPVKPIYQGVEMIGVFANSYQPEHVMTMPHFLCHYHTVLPRYAYYMNNMRKADSLWWRTTKLTQPYEWGMSAGSAITKGYLVDAINDNVDTIVSPHALAGFIPVYAKAKTDLINLYKNNKGVYTLPADTSLKILWRYSPANPAWRATVVQGVDFATFLFGIGSLPEYLGPDFFARNNDFFSPAADFNYTPAVICSGSCVQFKINSPSAGGYWKWTFQGSTTTSSTVQNPSAVCYPSAGKFMVSLLDSNACSSKMHATSIVVNALPAQPVITQISNQLACSAATSYQWYFNNVPVNGALKQKINISHNGLYYVCIKDGSACESCSVPFNAVMNEVETIDTAENLVVFPNPAQKEITISGFIPKQNQTLKLINAQGQCVKVFALNNLIDNKNLLIGLYDLPVGMYSLVYQASSSIQVKKIIITQ
jgi:PKD repeat protein